MANYTQDIQPQSLRYSCTPPISSTTKLSLVTKDPEAPSECDLQAQTKTELAPQVIGQPKLFEDIVIPELQMQFDMPTGFGSASSAPLTQISQCWPENHGKTALHISAERGNIRIVRMLLHYGADVNGTDSKGRSALHYASRGAHIDVVAQLLAVGADPDAQDHEGRSPLHAAADAESEAVIRLLAEEGADLNAAIGMSPAGREEADILLAEET